MKYPVWMKKTSMIVLSVSLILFSLLTSVFIQPSTSKALGKNTSTGKQHVLTNNGEKQGVITLITGDIVTVSKDEAGESFIDVEPADPGTITRMTTIGDDTYVIPNEAMPYLASGKLDKELFNITALLEYGYDDDGKDSIPIIVQYPKKTKAKTLASSDFADAKEAHVLQSIQSIAVQEEKKQTGNLWKELTKDGNARNHKTKDGHATFNKGVEKIWLDGQVKSNLADSVPQVHAPEAWESGYNGKGTKVAVIDSGIDNEHPDLVDQLSTMKSFVPDEDALDRHGHGTHVASTVLGTGAASDGMYKGVAPGAELLVGKVLDDSGTGQDSWVIAGMEWAARHADVVNMSLGGTQPSDGSDPLSQAINALSVETGALFVVAAGNAGREESISSPSAAEAALTVGNVDKSDDLSPTSSMGPRIGDMAIKPDLAAPGEEIVAARSHYADSGNGMYIAMSGTSMASPHVAGAAAIMKQRHPDWTGEQIKTALMSTTDELEDYQPYQVGTGRLNVATAVKNDLRATGSVSFGFFKWPYDNLDPVEKDVTYYNDGDKDITLDLKSSFANEDGEAAATDMLKLSKQSVTVPANGNAKVTVTLNPKLAAEGTRYWGQLRASSDGETVVHTALGMVKEDEKYPLTIEATDQDGSPAPAYVELAGSAFENPEFIEVEGETEVRLPKGTYSVMSLMEVNQGTKDEGVALVGDPEIQLDQATTVKLDAEKANKITVDVPKQTEPSYQRLDYYRKDGKMDVNTQYLLPPYLDHIYAMPMKQVKSGEFEMLSRWRLIKPLVTVQMDDKKVDVTPLPGMTTINGKYQLETVFAENGAPDDYKKVDATDKAVLVQRNKNITAAQQADAALDAGAKMLIIANDNDATWGEYVGKADGSDIPLAVASVNQTEGDILAGEIAQGNVVFDVEGTPDTPYLYDLVDAHTGEIPENLSYAPKPDELAKVTSQYTSKNTGVGTAFRYDRRPYSMRSMGLQQLLSIPTVRDEWVSATKDTQWYEQSEVMNDSNPEDLWDISGTQVTYKPGERIEQSWFSPVVQPRFGEGFLTPFRDFTGGFQFNVPAYADSGVGHTGWMSDDEKRMKYQQLKAYQGDTLLGETKGQMLITWDELPDEQLPYRLVSDAKRDADKWDSSLQTHTEWSFVSKGVAGEDVGLPLLSFNYQADVNTAGHLVAGRTTDLQLDVTQIDGVSGYGEMKDISLDVSYDEGKAWKKMDLMQDGDSWTVGIHPPKDAKSISLKAHAADDAKNEITQEIMTAFALTTSGAADMSTLVEQLADDGAINKDVVRPLQLQLKTIKLFEEQGKVDKVVKHVKGLRVLLDRDKKQDSLSDRAYNLLQTNAEYLNGVWK